MFKNNEIKLNLNDIQEQFPVIYNFLVDANIVDRECGKYYLENGIYLNIENYITEESALRQFESHRKYVDLQIMIEGKEIIEVIEKDKLLVADKYDEKKDIEFYHNQIQQTNTSYEINTTTGLLLFPNNAHKPCINLKPGDSKKVKKVVFKIPFSNFFQTSYIIMDVDGTLTDGNIYMSDNSELIKAFNVKDGYGIKAILKTKNIIPIIITGRKSEILKKRCEELNIKELYQDIVDKETFLKSYIMNNNITISNVAYIGDDVNDYYAMKFIKQNGGCLGCPKNAVEIIKTISDFISEFDSGNGAVRDFIDWICLN